MLLWRPRPRKRKTEEANTLFQNVLSCQGPESTIRQNGLLGFTSDLTCRVTFDDHHTVDETPACSPCSAFMGQLKALSLSVLWPPLTAGLLFTAEHTYSWCSWTISSDLPDPWVTMMDLGSHTMLTPTPPSWGPWAGICNSKSCRRL